MRHPGGSTVIIFSLLMVVLSTGCAQKARDCPSAVPLDISRSDQYALDDVLPFRFPLDDLNTYFKVDAALFADHGITSRGPEYHAAEDLHKPAGTPVYAMADGKISFSGPKGGYGWLIIIDHPQANLYSLYGHLSPSRWRLESGLVEKGDLIAYLGDYDENGGSRENPMRPHLHLGVRTGQRSDYPARGQWRWMAGWIKPCPQDLGWLQPSLVINNQDIPVGGFQTVNGNFLEKWSVELVMGAVYLMGAVSMVVYGMKRDKPYLLLILGGFLLAAGVYFYVIGWKLGYALFGLAFLLAVTGIILLIRRLTKRQKLI
jgi:hypothetical protein